MAVDVVTEIEIGRPRVEVAAFACDPDNATRWYENIDSVVWRTPRPLRVGTELEFVARFLGRTLAYTYEVREHQPGERFVMRTAQGPFPMETTYAFEDAAQPGPACRLRQSRCAAHGARDAARQSGGSPPPQGARRGELRASSAAGR